MPFTLKISLIIVSCLIFFSTLRLVRNNKMPVKYSLIWLISPVILLVVAVFTHQFEKISSLVGFEVLSNFVVGILITFLLLITRMLTKIVSEQNKKIIILTQELSILKENVKEKKR